MASEFDNELEAPEMEALANLAENLIYRLPGIADIMVRKTIQEVYRDFCRRSCCLHGRRYLKIGHDCDGKVLFAPLYGGMVDLVTDVCINGHRLYDTDYVNRGGTVHLPRRFVPSEFDVYDIDALVVEIPAMNSESVPSWFVQRHGDSICSGVLARLMSMTGKPCEREWRREMGLDREKICMRCGKNFFISKYRPYSDPQHCPKCANILRVQKAHKEKLIRAKSTNTKE